MKHYDTFKKAVFTLALLIGAGILNTGFSQTVFEFTNCGATGQDGPSVADATAEYSGTTLDGTVTVIDGIQYWTVPATGDYSIEVFGAEGGDFGGLGAQMYGEFSLTGGTELKMIVGQMGGTTDGQHGSGGGGSFVVFSADDAPIIIAGGGGGHGKGSPGINAETDGSALEAGQTPPTSGSPGGIDGGGGAAASGASGGTATTPGSDSPGSTWASGGGGLLTRGGACTAGTVPGGRAFVDGGRGGDAASSGTNSPGGFGCGGGAGDRGGGGGGYSGGGGGRSNNDGGGGGGSFNSGTAQVNVSGANSGHGRIVITQLCLPLDVDITDTGVCTGEEVTMTATSTSGGTITWDMGVDNGVAFVPPGGATTYTATSTSDVDCPFDVEITSTDVPTITASADPPSACEGALITLTGEGGDMYVWTGDGDIDPVDGEPFPAEDGTTTYTVEGSLLGCEGEPFDVVLEGAPQPDVSGIATPNQICLGESFVLTGDGDATAYDWGLGIEDGDAITPESAGTFVYTVIGTSDAGCGDTATATVTVFPTAVVDAGADLAVCEDEDVTLNGSGASTYTWDGGITDGVAFPALVGSTTYTVTGEDLNGCTDEDEVIVFGYERPIIDDAVITDEFFGFDGAIDITVSGGSGDYYFAWSHGPSTEDVSALTAGTYTVIIDDKETDPGLCPTEATFEIASFVGLDQNDLIEINIYPTPTVDFVTVQVAGEFNYELTSLNGEIIFSGTATDQEKVDLQALSSGVYLLNVLQDGKHITKEIVKQ